MFNPKHTRRSALTAPQSKIAKKTRPKRRADAADSVIDEQSPQPEVDPIQRVLNQLRSEAREKLEAKRNARIKRANAKHASRLASIQNQFLSELNSSPADDAQRVYRILLSERASELTKHPLLQNLPTCDLCHGVDCSSRGVGDSAFESMRVWNTKDLPGQCACTFRMCTACICKSIKTCFAGVGFSCPQCRESVVVPIASWRGIMISMLPYDLSDPTSRSWSEWTPFTANQAVLENPRDLEEQLDALSYDLSDGEEQSQSDNVVIVSTH